MIRKMIYDDTLISRKMIYDDTLMENSCPAPLASKKRFHYNAMLMDDCTRFTINYRIV